MPGYTAIACLLQSLTQRSPSRATCYLTYPMALSSAGLGVRTVGRQTTRLEVASGRWQCPLPRGPIEWLDDGVWIRQRHFAVRASGHASVLRRWTWASEADLSLKSGSGRWQLWTGTDIRRGML